MMPWRTGGVLLGWRWHVDGNDDADGTARRRATLTGQFVEALTGEGQIVAAVDELGRVTLRHKGSAVGEPYLAGCRFRSLRHDPPRPPLEVVYERGKGWRGELVAPAAPRFEGMPFGPVLAAAFRRKPRTVEAAPIRPSDSGAVLPAW